MFKGRVLGAETGFFPAGREKRRGPGLFRVKAGLTIRTRLILLASAALLVLIATNAYLTRALTDNTAGMVEAAGLLAGIEQADSTRIAFGEVRYWMTDLAVSQLTLAERNAAAARARMEEYLGKRAPWSP